MWLGYLIKRSGERHQAEQGGQFHSESIYKIIIINFDLSLSVQALVRAMHFRANGILGVEEELTDAGHKSVPIEIVANAAHVLRIELTILKINTKINLKYFKTDA